MMRFIDAYDVIILDQGRRSGSRMIALVRRRTTRIHIGESVAQLSRQLKSGIRSSTSTRLS